MQKCIKINFNFQKLDNRSKNYKKNPLKPLRKVKDMFTFFSQKSCFLLEHTGTTKTLGYSIN